MVADIPAVAADNCTGVGNFAVGGVDIQAVAGRIAGRIVRGRSCLCQMGNQIVQNGWCR